jgi:hypothetical protein
MNGLDSLYSRMNLLSISTITLHSRDNEISDQDFLAISLHSDTAQFLPKQVGEKEWDYTQP